jgi:phosphate transport system protein
MSEHTIKAFDHELEALSRRIVDMGAVVEKVFGDALDGLTACDVNLAGGIVASGPRLDALRREIEGSAIVIIAREQPVSVDLRECIAAIRIAGDLERVGRRSIDIANRAVVLTGESFSPRAFIGLKLMRQFAAKQLSGVLEAYTQRDVARARAIWLGDVELDALEDSFFRDMLTFMMEDARNVPFCTHLLFCSKNLERIGDHATNIAEMVVWMVTGESMPIERPKK